MSALMKYTKCNDITSTGINQLLSDMNNLLSNQHGEMMTKDKSHFNLSKEEEEFLAEDMTRSPKKKPKTEELSQEFLDNLLSPENEPQNCEEPSEKEGIPRKPGRFVNFRTNSKR